MGLVGLRLACGRADGEARRAGKERKQAVDPGSTWPAHGASAETQVAGLHAGLVHGVGGQHHLQRRGVPRATANETRACKSLLAWPDVFADVYLPSWMACFESGRRVEREGPRERGLQRGGIGRAMEQGKEHAEEEGDPTC